MVDGEDPFKDELRILSTGGFQTMTPRKCTCSFTIATELPCHHILCVSELKGMSLYATDFYANRWTKDHYLNNHIT